VTGSGKIVLAFGVYDNADILREFVEWHYHLGIDFAIAYDYGSQDGSRDILADLGRRKLVDWMTIPDKNYMRFDPFTRIAHRARDEFKADWIIVVDTDEFVCPPCYGLRAALDLARSEDIAVVTMPGFNMTGVPLTTGQSAPATLTLRVDRGVQVTREQTLSGDLPVPYVFIRNLSKTIVQASALIAYTLGGHTAQHASGRSAEISALSFRHYPFRSYEAFETKVRNTAGWLDMNPEFTGGLAWHWHRWVRLYREGRLREEHDAQFLLPARASELVRDGVCTIDEAISSWAARRRLEGP
jgi:Glycosyl transferase family 2